jgi:hypothetical protein
MAEARYRAGGDNRVLRHVLYEVWGKSCYWRQHVKEYNDLQIDHIVPRTLEDDALRRLKDSFKLDDEYDLDALHNLAPICGPCNREKSNTDLTTYLPFLIVLKKAKRLAPMVAKRLRTFQQPSELGAALLRALEVDLSDVQARATFEELAPAVTQRLADLNPANAGHVIFSNVQVEAADEMQDVGLTLDEAGRSAVRALESVVGVQLDDALKAPVTDLFARMSSLAEDALEDHNEGLGTPDAEAGSVVWPQIRIDHVDYRSIPHAEMEFAFAGSFEAVVEATIARDSLAGDNVEYVQGEAVVNGRFSFTLTWETGRPSEELFFDQVFLENADAETWIEGMRTQAALYDWDDDAPA